MKLVLIRHGKTQYAKEGRFAGSAETPLSDEGREELKQLKETLEYPESDFYFTSGQLRANETFDILFPDKKLDGYFTPFMEHTLGDLEGKPVIHDKELMDAWLKDESTHGIEIFSDFQNRVIKGLQELCYKYQDKTVTVVCHAGIVRAIYMYLKKLEPMHYRKLHIKNGNGFIFEINYIRNEFVLKDFSTLDHEPIYYFDDFKFVVVRHGTTDGNTAMVLTGCDHEYMLTKDGIAELERLAKTVKYPETDMHFTTTLLRAQDTFKILYPNMEIDDKLYKCREISFGKYDGVSIHTINHNNLFDEWLTDDHDMGFERFYKFKNRCVDGLVDIMDECGDRGYNSATLVCHMGTMRAILIHLLRINPHTYMSLQAKNGSGHILHIKADRQGYEVLSDEDIY